MRSAAIPAATRCDRPSTTGVACRRVRRRRHAHPTRLRRAVPASGRRHGRRSAGVLVAQTRTVSALRVRRDRDASEGGGDRARRSPAVPIDRVEADRARISPDPCSRTGCATTSSSTGSQPSGRGRHGRVRVGVVRGVPRARSPSVLGVDDVLGDPARGRRRGGRLTGRLDGRELPGPEKVRRGCTPGSTSTRRTSARRAVTAYGDSPGDRELLADADPPTGSDAGRSLR